MPKETDYFSQYVKCPFYLTETRTCISCEGFCDACKNIRIGFNSGRDLKRHKEIFCKNKYANCEIYNAINTAKYED